MSRLGQPPEQSFVADYVVLLQHETSLPHPAAAAPAEHNLYLCFISYCLLLQSSYSCICVMCLAAFVYVGAAWAQHERFMPIDASLCMAHI